jgi:hypothetical protein
VPQGSIFGPLFFLGYIYDLPNTIEHKGIPVLFAEDNSILISNTKNIHFQSNLNVVFGQVSKWLKANLLTLNFDKIYLIQCTNNSTRTSDVPNYVRS